LCSTTNIANSSSYSAHNSLDCIADAAIIQQQQQQEQESQMQEDIYAKKFKKAHRRLKIDSDGPAVIPDAVAAEVGARINTSTASIVLEMYNLGAGG
jgi:hypothetical protein